jgi:branched-chain amino acid transport system ATP-binding protein
MSQAILQVRDLHAAYGKAEVLHGISFDLHAGEVVTIIGPNGAGKTTLLGSLMGLLPCQGKLSFEGREIHELPLEERVMLGLSLVPERRELFGSMPVEDNLLLGGYRRMRQGVSNWRDELDHVYALFPRLKERREQKAGTLSGGERQMLAVGRALMAKPHILMLDEPSLGLASKPSSARA